MSILQFAKVTKSDYCKSGEKTAKVPKKYAKCFADADKCSIFAVSKRERDTNNIMTVLTVS